MGGGHPIIGGAGYCILTSITVVIFGAALFILTGAGAGGHPPTPHIGGATAGITIGCGAGIAPVYVSAHTMPAAATTIRMNPRIPIFLTIPSSSFRQTHYI
jgi:hypothetical protein